MSTYACPEFAATGIELQIIELQVRRQAAEEQGSAGDIAACDAEIARLWGDLADLAEHHPEALAPPAT